MAQGKLIAIEGVDGAGTTTQAERLARRFGLHLTREPSHGVVGKLLREILRGEHGPVNEETVALLFAADRRDHVVSEIEPRLAAGQSVITDRYVLSSVVYQSEKVPRDFVLAINRLAPPPRLTILLDVDAEVAAERRAQRGGHVERYDHDDTQRRLVAAYRREIAHVSNGAIVDGNAPPDEVFALLEPLVRSCLGASGGADS
jgi:dTMP kinase